ncbi:MAG: lipase, partial [Rhizobiaceae bacterium]
TYASKLKDAGVAVNTKTYNGVTHEFFGMGKVVPEAKQALDLAVADLTAAFDKAK